MESGRLMRSVLAAAGAVLAAAAIAAPAAAASPSPAATGPAIGGAQLSGRGVLVNYPSGFGPPAAADQGLGAALAQGEQAHAVADGRHGLAGDLVRAGGAVGEDAVECGLV